MQVYGDFFNEDDDEIRMSRWELRKHSMWVAFWWFIGGGLIGWYFF